MMRIDLEHVIAAIGDRRFGPVHATLTSGSRLALLGPSGSGKTTLLRAIAGLAPTASGTLRIDGADATTWAPERRRLAYLHQTPRLFPHLDVLGNVALARRVAGDPQAESAARRWLDAVRLTSHASAGIDGLSGGERQRVALARALASQPRALLLDEPFSALDPTLRLEVREMVDQVLAADGPAAILVTHDLEEAAAFAETVVTLLPEGTVWTGAIATLMHRPPTVALARFVGLENLVPSGLVPGAGPTDAALLAFRAAAGQAALDPEGPWVVERCRPAEAGYRVELRSAGGHLVACAPAPLPSGAGARLVLDPRQLLAYRADGTLVEAG